MTTTVLTINDDDDDDDDDEDRLSVEGRSTASEQDKHRHDFCSMWP